MSIERLYLEAMRNLWGKGYWVTWQPSVRLRLGEVGKIVAGQFVPTDHLDVLGINYKIVPSESRDELTYHSVGGVHVHFKAAGKSAKGFQALVSGDAGALVRFNNAEGLFIAMSGLSESRLASQSSLAQIIVERYLQGTWVTSSAVVSHLVAAASGIVLASAEANSEVELRAAGTVGSGPTTIGHLGANVGIARAEKVGFQFVGTASTPYFRVLRLKDSWLKGLVVRFGDSQPFRTGGGLTPTAYRELLEEADCEPDVVLEDVVQLAAQA